MLIEREDFGTAWRTLLADLYDKGQFVYPRGIACRELLGVTLKVDQGLSNVLVDPVRKPSYRFMVAEWLWIYFGRNDVASISKYNPVISRFSDDGKIFAGAYGPPVRQQWPQLVRLLKEDPQSRQAVLQIFSQPRGQTKDVPCTLNLQFFIRDQKLHTIASMRSSDVWLGLPYDVFNFTMLANCLSAELGPDINVGTFTIHLGSSHLYETNVEAAGRVFTQAWTQSLESPQLDTPPPIELDDLLAGKYAVRIENKPWCTYACALTAATNKEALEWLYRL